MAFKPIDPKRDEFRRYLERSGVIEALTKVFVRIVKERPENPLEYLRHNLGDSLHQADNVAYLQSELEEARCEIQRLRDIIENVNPEALEEPPREEVEGVDAHVSLENEEKANRMEANGQQEAVLEGDLTNGTVSTSAAIPKTIASAGQKPDNLPNTEAPENEMSQNHITTETTPPAPTQEADNNS